MQKIECVSECCDRKGIELFVWLLTCYNFWDDSSPNQQLITFKAAILLAAEICLKSVFDDYGWHWIAEIVKTASMQKDLKLKTFHRSTRTFKWQVFLDQETDVDLLVPLENLINTDPRVYRTKGLDGLPAVGIQVRWLSWKKWKVKV